MLFDISSDPTGVPTVDPAAPSGPRVGYVYAGADAIEAQRPAGCTTPVMRKLWSRGQQVPADQYEAWRAGQPGGGPEPLAHADVVAERVAREVPRVG